MKEDAIYSFFQLLFLFQWSFSLNRNRAGCTALSRRATCPWGHSPPSPARRRASGRGGPEASTPWGRGTTRAAQAPLSGGLGALRGGPPPCAGMLPAPAGLLALVPLETAWMCPSASLETPLELQQPPPLALLPGTWLCRPGAQPHPAPSAPAP